MDWTTNAENRRLEERRLLLDGFGTFSGDWQPDWRASLPLAVVLALLVLAGLVSLPYRGWVPVPHPETISILLDQHLPETAQPRRKPAPHPEPVKHRETVPASSRPPVSKPPPINWAGQLNQAAKAQVQSRTQGQVEFLAPETKPQDRQLERALNAPIKSQNLKNGDAYHTATGDTVIKSGDQCGRVETLQMSESPTNRASVGFFTPCPGEYKPTMGEELKAWADRHAKKHPPP